MRKFLTAVAVALAATFGAGAQTLLPACNSTSSCFLFSTSGNGTFQIAAIPAGATVINVQIVVASGAVTGAFTAQIQTASSLTGGTALTSPTNCGSSTTVGTAAGAYSLTCTVSSSQPWAYVGVNFSGGTGATSGDLLTFQSSLVGKADLSTIPVTIAAGAWIGTGGSPSAACDTADGFTCTLQSGVIKYVTGSTANTNSWQTVFTLTSTTPAPAKLRCRAELAVDNGIGFFALQQSIGTTTTSFVSFSTQNPTTSTSFITYIVYGCSAA